VIRSSSHSKTVNIVARRRLEKTENLSACVLVNWKVCKSAIALIDLIKRDCNQSANKSNHPIYNPLFSSCVPPDT
jgi:hypothetical protein